ncbi:hypothetical protein TanjilG_11053 [Lupinus angustifolius]|uniref:GOLD domain-containing protein n=1 Tax=Lupinus angustifolius TaxID=3871 RepID=A0A1J7HTB6_LUPAN|nr:hypothetical protein TanjilG_11053 [Lupinus angustifolius]
MKMRLPNLAFAVVILFSLNAVLGIRFVLDREDCFSHNIQHVGDTIHASFVVIQADIAWHWQNSKEGVDLVVKGPSGELVQDFHDSLNEKFEIVARQKGLYRFCFTNKSPYHETIDFDAHSFHFSYFDQHAQDDDILIFAEHFNPLLEQISKLEEALYNIQFEQHWLGAQTERQAIVNNSMSTRTLHKAILEAIALIGASILQIYLIRRLFERKLGVTRV